MKITPTLGGAYSGSLGGLTASHNRGGAYLRRRVVPVNPDSARQAAVRTIFGGLVQAWLTELSDAQREAWRTYASNTPTTDTLGQALVLTGQQAFVRANTARLQADLDRVDEAPIIFNTGEPPALVNTFALTTAGTGLTIAAVLAANASAQGSFLLYIGRPQNASVQFYKGPYQLAFIGSFPADLAALDAVLATYPDDWLSDIILTPADFGARFPLRFVALYEDGRVSQDLRVIVPLTEDTGP